ncbi:hypothetical protein H8958_002875 [Nasalis larvatus]
MQTTTTLALMFGLYEDLSCLLRKHVSAPEFATCCVAAVLAGTAEAIFTPLEIVQTLLQDHKHHDKFTNTYQTFKALKYNGIGEYYRGLVPILFLNELSNVLFEAFEVLLRSICLPKRLTVLIWSMILSVKVLPLGFIFTFLAVIAAVFLSIAGDRYANTYLCIAFVNSIQDSDMLYRFVA